MLRILPLLIVLSASSCSSRQTVVVYSPHGADMLRDYEKLFEDAHPDIDLQWLDMGSKDVFSRVSAERNRPSCDVWWGAPSTFFAQAAEEGLLAPYKPSWWDDVDDDYRDSEDRWYGTSQSPLAILFNTRAYENEDMPNTWDGLLDEEWSGKVTLRAPLASGTMRTFLSAMIARAETDDAGIAWLSKLHDATITYPESPNLMFDHVKKNENRISVWLMRDVIMQRERNGYPFGYKVPTDTPVIKDCVAIVKGAPHPELAKVFYEFVTTKEALLQQAKDYALLPARRSIDASKLPAELTEQVIRPMPIDWTEFAAKEEAWCARWDTEVYHRP